MCAWGGGIQINLRNAITPLLGKTSDVHEIDSVQFEW